MSDDCDEYMPVVAGLSLAGWPLAAAGGIHKVVHDNSHDGHRALKLSARDISEEKGFRETRRRSSRTIQEKKEIIKKCFF